MHAKSLQVQDQPVSWPLLPNTEQGVREMFVAIDWVRMCTVYSYKERLLSAPYIVLCSIGRYSISQYTYR